MSYNRTLLQQITKDMQKATKPKVPRNQWQHPGEITKIPSPNITMEGVGFPVIGVPNIGQPQMMYPEQNYYYPGADNVTEYPMMGAGGGIPERYKNMGFNKVGAKKNSTRPGKKWMVLAKKGDDYKVVHGGYDGMKDFSQHGSEQRKENFWDRMGGKNSSKATDPFSPLYWHKRFGTWQEGGQLDQYQTAGEAGTKYTVKPGQYLSQIAKANNVSVDDLVLANKIKDPNLIRPGQELFIPQGASAFRMPSKDGYVGFDQLMTRQQQLSSMPARDMVREFRSQNQMPGNYAVVDKKTGMMSIYNPQGKEVSSFSVGTGKDRGDQITINTTGPNRRNSTPAGIFTLTNKGTGRDSYAPDYGDNIWEMVDQNNVQQATALHQVPNNLQFRNALIGDKDPSNNRLSNGCINCRRKDFDQNIEKYMGKGSQIYILPEDENNKFVVKNNKIMLTGDKFDNQVAYSKRDLTAKPLQIKYAKSQFGEYAPNVQKMAQSLVDQKQALMRDLNIDNDTYNELAKLTLGVAGQESNYGDSWKYKYKESPEGQNDVRAAKTFAKVLSLQDPTQISPSSRGFTQIKYNSQNKKVRDLFAKYGIKSPDDLADPAKSNIGALIMMGHMYNNELPQLKDQMEKLGLTKSDAILYLNQGKRGEITKGTATPDKNLYIQNVKNFAKRFALNQKMQEGGALQKFQTAGQTKGFLEKWIDQHNAEAAKSGPGLFDRTVNVITEDLPNALGKVFNKENIYDGVMKGLDWTAATAIRAGRQAGLEVPEVVTNDIFTKIRPVSYPTDLGQAIAEYRRSDKAPPARDLQGDLSMDEEAWSMNLGRKTKSKYIVPSKYKPSISDDPNAKYHTFAPGVIDPAAVAKLAADEAYWKKNAKVNKKGVQYLPMKSMKPIVTKQFMDSYNKYAKMPFDQTDPMANFQIYRGVDPKTKKKYAAISDTYDFGLETANAATNPINFYDRIYYNQGGSTGGSQNNWLEKYN